MLGNITILSGAKIPRKEYLAYRASLHAGATEAIVAAALRRCETGESDFPEDFPESLYEMAEAICADVVRSGGEVDPIIEEQVHQHTRTETPLEAPQEESEGDVAVMVLEAVPDTDTLILNAAKNARLDNSYTELREKFDFSQDMTDAQVKPGVIIAPEDFGQLAGFALDLGKRSLWLAGGAILALQALGKESAIEAIADEFGFSYSHASNLARVCDRIPPDKRHGLLPTVAQEIATRQYSTDPQKNRKIILELCDKAKSEKMNCAQARSNAMLAQGKDVPIVDYSGGKKKLKEQLDISQARVVELETVLRGVLDCISETRGVNADSAVFAARECLGIVQQAEEVAV